MSSKRQERVCLVWFLENTRITCPRIQDANPPDFILYFDGRKVAAEVTRVFIEPDPGRKGSKCRQQESHRTQWLRSLAESYYQKTDVPIQVQVLLPGSASLDEGSSSEVLSSLLKSSELVLWKQQRYELDLAPGTVKLFVLRLPVMARFTHYSRWTCQNDHMRFAPRLSEDHVGNAVRRKEHSLRRYRADYDETWLLVVVDGSWRSGILDVPAGWENRMVSGTFCGGMTSISPPYPHTGRGVVLAACRWICCCVGGRGAIPLRRA